MSLIERSRKIHFIGIGGIGMSGLAELLLKLGHHVSGSDQNDSESVQRLIGLGAKIQIHHGDEIMKSMPPDVVVYSTAVPPTNPELSFARAQKIPIIRRAEMLGELMRLKRGIAIAGSHGKTTTTGFVSMLLSAGGLDPTVVIGGRFDAIGSNASLGAGRWLVAEADESDGTFLKLTPEIAVVTNIDREHLDHYKNFESVIAAFEDFIDRVPFYGRAVLCSDCENIRSIAARLQKPCVYYGFDEKWEPDFLVRLLEEGASPRFEILEKKSNYKKPWLAVQLSVPGRHNILNATAAALVARELEVSNLVISNTLKDFHGVSRRFQMRGNWKGHPVIEDYAHHPTEIRATLAAALSVYAPLKPVVLFQPHRFTRTRDLWQEFSSCFEGAQSVFTLPIYAASEPREDWVKDVDLEAFAKNIKGGIASYCPTRDSLVEGLMQAKKSEKISEKAPILVLGAGDIYKMIPSLIGDSN